MCFIIIKPGKHLLFGRTLPKRWDNIDRHIILYRALLIIGVVHYGVCLGRGKITPCNLRHSRVDIIAMWPPADRRCRHVAIENRNDRVHCEKAPIGQQVATSYLLQRPSCTAVVETSSSHACWWRHPITEWERFAARRCLHGKDRVLI